MTDDVLEDESAGGGGSNSKLLLAALLVGSLPATRIGTKLSSRMPENVLQPILATVLLLLGLKYTLPLLTGAAPLH